MKWPKNETHIKLKLVFRSGYEHEMWVKDLQKLPDGHIEWEHCDDDNSLVEFSPDDICCILRIGSRKRTVWE